MLDIANELKFNGETAVIDFYGLPLINNEREIAFSVILQNAMQPKNPQRRDSITGKTYSELRNVEEARSFLGQTLGLNLKNEIAGR